MKNTNHCTINSKINGTPQMFLLAHFEATIYFSRAKFTCLLRLISQRTHLKFIYR